MDIIVRSQDAKGADAYRRVAEIRAHDFPVEIDKIEMEIDPEEGVFAARLAYKEARGSFVTIANIAESESEDGETIFRIKDETYAPTLLRYLWDAFGRSMVEQPNRLEILVKTEIEEDFMQSVIFEPSEEFLDDIITFLELLAPEGFRIWNVKKEKNALLVVASEEVLSTQRLDQVFQSLQT
ncbi:MAG: Uncharacterized conserved protein UCP019464, methanogenesis [Candidatus Syntrophoarchaeum caldarius]|uniref:Uncharacterized conserved protein UCP019464, methanogenesis n=1 Tax=Candidatus Syntropharchaeum caldarium TaxID=1838285 RepID=A0A1F2P9J5_9EURY|nr:MAG: Uncharacterized conserved protein UCP019464, methanogenesis [Candidatus Syntrophoarchaeum caldarius]